MTTTGWNGEGRGGAEDGPGAPGPGMWLPPRGAAAQAAEGAAARREQREAKGAREARREQLADGALNLYRSQAESRGEVVSAMALARGEIGGRDIDAILADAGAAADREDARQ